MSYDYTTDPSGSDPLVKLADEVMSDILSKTCVFGNWTVDVVPFCASTSPSTSIKTHFINFLSFDSLVRHLPEWLPGMEFKRKGREWAKTVASLSDRPYTFVQHQMVQFEQMTWIIY